MKEYDLFKKDFNITKDSQLSNWSGITISEMARCVGMLEDYYLIYVVCCNYSHPSYLGLIQNIEKKSDATIFSTSSSQHIPFIIKQAIPYFFQMLFIFNYLFELNVDKELEDFNDSFVLLLKGKR